MGDHLVLMVNRLLTESTLAAAIESQTGLDKAAALMEGNKIDFVPIKLVECRICHDEDEDLNMETPCSCCGSLKYAHRKCIQRWCNEKGDTVCEICNQQFKHGYTAPVPPPLFNHGAFPMDFRGNWGVSRRDMHNPHFISMVVTDDHEFMDSDIEEYSASDSRSLICCRVVAIIFMVLLVLRHTLPIVVGGDSNYSITLFTLVVLRTIGILLPVCIMAKACLIIQRRRQQQQDDQFAVAESDEENDLPHLNLTASRFVHIH